MFVPAPAPASQASKIALERTVFGNSLSASQGDNCQLRFLRRKRQAENWNNSTQPIYFSFSYLFTSEA